MCAHLCVQSINLEAQIAACVSPLLSNPSSIDPGVHAMILLLQRVHNELKFIVTRMEKVGKAIRARNL
jgi:hypothetical protein